MPRLSEPIEALIAENAVGSVIEHADAVIVGSGYGGSFAAARLAGEGREVLVLERGREYAPGEFPATIGDAPRHMRFSRPGDAAPIGYADALFDLHLEGDMDVLVGSGVGGTSLINANVAIEPDAEVFGKPEWPRAIREAASQGSLGAHFEAARRLLRVSTFTKVAKYAALERLAGELGAECGPAPIAVATQRGDNAVGIHQEACTGCGNCVSGCNVGAKNTLAMNVLPLACARGARIYSNATVLSVRRDADPAASHPWTVRLRRTTVEKTPFEDEFFVVRARKVVLAAGTLGSTEILMRSELAGLALSTHLGTRFSGNGDALAFGYGQEHPVEALGERDFLHPAVKVGPTITALARSRSRRDGFATLEDGAVPYAMLRLFEEIVTTGAQLHRLVEPQLPAWHLKRKGVDPLSLTEGAQRSTQVLLLMGDDGGNGKLDLRYFGPNLDRVRIRVAWPDAGKSGLFERGHARLAREDRGEGFDGGQFVPNPLWKLVPDKAAKALSGGDALGGRALTVHPLGGCPMGEDAASGVVDDMGRVFDAGSRVKGAVHEGLFVLDGSIVPRALGINPFLTIAALAHRAADAIAGSWPESPRRTVPAGMRHMYPVPTEVPPRPPPVHLVLRERLVGTLIDPATGEPPRLIPKWLPALHPDPRKAARWMQDKGLILDLRMDMKDLEAWLRGGPSTPFDVMPGQTRLVSNWLEPEVTRRAQVWHTPDDHIREEDVVATAIKGSVRLMVADDDDRLARTWEAIWTYLERRVPSKGFNPFQAGAFLDIAAMHATYRRLEYSIDFLSATGKQRFRVEGTKVLAWKRGWPRLCDALLVLPLRFRRLDEDGQPIDDEAVEGRVEVDGKFLASSGAPQIATAASPSLATQPGLPEAIAALSGFGLFFLRSIFQTHFWEFGAPTYPGAVIRPVLDPPPLRVAGGKLVTGDESHFEVPLRASRPAPSEQALDPRAFAPADADRIELRLVRYPQPGRPPVLLAHGLAQGSTIFTRHMLDRNMAEYLWDAGYDVWVVDYRLSHLLRRGVPPGGWAMDELGCFDLPEAIARVYEGSGRQPVRFFAHCLGATATTMGILSGRIPAGMLHCVAFNAVHPWIMPSAVNEVRAMVGTFFRDVLGSEPLEPIPSPRPSAAEVVVDRLAHAVARYGELAGDPHRVERELELENAVCDRMSLLYGRMWSHANLHERTHKAFTTLVGPAPGDVYRHLYYYSMRKRLTDREGLNLYLTDKNLERWTVPTLFMHGEDSMVFNPHSATRSAIRMNEIVNAEDAVLARGGRVIPIGARRFEGYGHMDVVFAKSAADGGRSFPFLRDFFADPAMAAQWRPGKDETERHMGAVWRITAGPALRAAWISGGRMFVRFWGEHVEEVTALIEGLRFDSKQAAATTPLSIRVQGAESRYHFLDVEITARSGPVDYDLVGNAKGSIVVTPLRLRQAQQPRYRFEDGLAWLGRLRAAAQGAFPGDMRFLVASCRYPGTPFERERADAVFAGMLSQVNGPGGAAVHMQFLLGDQIYADATANLLDATFWRERYSEQYRSAFTSKNFRELILRVPTHFTVDDHEFRDNWSGDPPPRPTEDTENARRAARSFMTSARDQVQVGASRGAPFWYPLDPAAELCRPTFVMDARSEREARLHGRGTSPAMIGPDQMQALERWLDANAREPGPKFIVASTGIAPVSRGYRAARWRCEDGWLGYPATCARICEGIARRGMRDVVIVSGDLHLSAASRIHVNAGGSEAVIWELVSSGLYAPLPFANARPEEFDWGTPVSVGIPGSGIQLTTESYLLYQGDPHFMRVDVDTVGGGARLELSILDAAGQGRELDARPPAWLRRVAPGRWALPGT